jgi:AcrR family transcriptional regulator
MNDSTDTATGEESIPPSARKRPKQSRSRMLVDSVKQACLKILNEQGPGKLTAVRLSDVSGVAVGSIYQYFPNIEAVIASVYEDLIEEEIQNSRGEAKLNWPNMTLAEYVRTLARGTIAFNLRMLALDRDFHQRFCSSFELQAWFNRKRGDPRAATREIFKILVANQDKYPLRNAEVQAFIITSAFRSTILDAVKYHPEYLEDPDYPDYLVYLCLGVIGARPD